MKYPRLPTDFLQTRIKTNSAVLRYYGTNSASGNGESNASDEEHGHRLAYYEQYKQLFQHDNIDNSVNNDDTNDTKNVPKQNIVSQSSNEDRPVPAELNREGLTHTDADGKVKMVDVGDKPVTKRTAQAYAAIRLGKEAFYLVRENKMKKGDVLAVAQIAGIMAAKQTSSVIPLCHAIPLSKVDVIMLLDETNASVEITSEVRCDGKTGVEMEALTAVTVAALTVYDMCKAVTHDMVISDVKLLRKEGGRTGSYSRSN